MRKIIIIIGVIFGILALAGGIYFAWKKSQEILTPPTSPTIPIITAPAPPISPIPPTSNLKSISDQTIFDYFIRHNLDEGGLTISAEIFYITQDGKIFKIIENAEDEIISSQPIENIQLIKSSANGERILIKYGKRDSPQFNIFNAVERIWELLPSEITAADFSPDSKKIAYLKTNNGKSDLITKNISETKTTKIISLSQKDLELKWLTNENILLLPKPSSQIDSDIWSINIINKTLKKIASGRGLMTNWSADGSLGIKFFVDQKRNSSLDLINDDGITQANFDFSTLPNKCLLTLNKIYCAIPQTHSSTQEPILPDDYLKRNVYFEDFIYEMDIEQNTFEIIYTETKSAIDAFRLSILDNQLLFINRYDNILYKLVISD